MKFTSLSLGLNYHHIFNGKSNSSFMDRLKINSLFRGKYHSITIGMYLLFYGQVVSAEDKAIEVIEVSGQAIINHGFSPKNTAINGPFGDDLALADIARSMTPITNEMMEQLNITDLQDILANESRRMQIIKDELIYIKDKYGDERRSIIEYAGGDFSIEDMIPNEKVVVTISHLGYMKRTSLSEYRLQNRGGVGSKGTPSDVLFNTTIESDTYPTRNTSAHRSLKVHAHASHTIKLLMIT